MNCSSEQGQDLLRQCALGQAQFWLHFGTHTFRMSMELTPRYTERQRRIEQKTKQLKEASVSLGTLGRYSKNFKQWETFCNDFGFPVWIDELPRAQQARMVGLFAGLCASEGHNKSKTGNKCQTFDGKMAAVAFTHKAVRNAKLDYHDPEFELVAQGYKRINSQVDRKQPVTTPMLLKMRESVEFEDPLARLLWGYIVLGFFFLDRSSELWGLVTPDKSTGSDRVHCVKAQNVILRNKQGQQVDSESTLTHSVEFIFESHKGDRIGQGTVVRHYRSNHRALCPVEAARECLRVRTQWLSERKDLGPYLTSISRKTTIKKSKVADLNKTAAKNMGLAPKDYSTHSCTHRRRLCSTCGRQKRPGHPTNGPVVQLVFHSIHSSTTRNDSRRSKQHDQSLDMGAPRTKLRSARGGIQRA
ncbi:hypothetical protein V7S43_005298 [Phytophthora oleae]|uniref:PiggyBac transposable element-derived protein domain-containing protein n=1 Tax=Phytophthora oleae TaxID=2107226 RepID=A0ABD3FWD5_9STRA